MTDNHVIHLVNSRKPIVWIEQMKFQALQSSRFQHKVLYFDNLFALALQSKSLFRTSFKQQSNRALILVAHGYKSSVFAYIVWFVIRIPYVIIHHHQPSFFEVKASIPFRIHSIIYRRTLLTACHVQALSSEVETKLLSLGVNSQNISVIGHGISETFLSSTPTPRRTSSTLRLLTVSRLSLEKNISRALYICHELKSLGQDFTLRIAGSGPESRMLESLCKDLGLTEEVFFVGHSADILKLYDDSDLFLHTAFTESYGQVLVEAASRHNFVLSTPVGVMNELIQQYEYCQVWNHGDPHSNALQIIDISNRLKASSGQVPNSNFLEWVRQEHAWFSCIERMLSNLDKIKLSL